MKSTIPTVSIIIPTFNRVAFLGETLDSILAQTFLNWECLVIDDGSEDHTDKLLEFYTEKDPRFFFYRRPQNYSKGANACRNFGFELCKGEYINWFDSDDLMHPQKLENQLRILQNSETKFCICQSMVFEKNQNEVIRLRFKNIWSEDFFYDYLTMKIGWLTQTPLWKREFLAEQEKLFDEELAAAQEWEFHLRMLKQIEEYSITKEVLVYLRKHEEGITYSDNESDRRWGYYFARLKIFQNKELELKNKEYQFLRNYLLNSFKKLILDRNVNAFKAFKKFILLERNMNISSKCAAILSIVSYRTFNRGNFILQKIKYN
ncbi:glycosyltransferase involved in cell wall biosynthesis [Christiangramia gaetbulicola]|uniref:Glycosyltransferase involved in cell wall biosynthesis n=1 Tax=Christiangramia gaetbulicola TaxID=703340 RepID=A0A2T6AJT6_9FLAO|nr:glycosyltransferase family 2 protein [Christiangramia gaetbulicola]PTX44082.1 glycosyltransferase involved in cell wall biosynthesis [Christiangramia gaetbulicola]